MDLEQLNQIARGIPTRKIKDLREDEPFMVTKMRQVNTRFGSRIIAELDRSFQIFLPDKVSSALLNDEEFFYKLMDAIQKISLNLSVKNGFVVFNYIWLYIKKYE